MSLEEFVTISDAAYKKIADVIAKQKKESLFLRLYIQRGPDGIEPAMAVDSRKSEDDQACLVNGLEVRIDRISFPYLTGAGVDYFESFDKEGFFQITSDLLDEINASRTSCSGCSGGAGCCG